MTREYYTAVFGAVRPLKDEENKLLDIYPDSYTEKLYNENPFTRRLLVHYDFEKPDPAYGASPTNLVARSGRFSYKLNDKNQFSPGISEKFSKLTDRDDSWIRLTGYVYFFSDEAIKGANLVVTANHDGQGYKYVSESLENDDLKIRTWNKVSTEWQTPYLKGKDDLLQSYIWYTGKDSIYVDDIQIEIFEPR
jgi:hypothetical protein